MLNLGTVVAGIFSGKGEDLVVAGVFAKMMDNRATGDA